jgi:hypothetical protein
MHGRYFELINFQHFMLYLFPAFIFLLVFAVGLAYTHFKGKDSERRHNQIIEEFPGGIQERNAPFPLVLTLTIWGTVIWAFFYIFFYGFLGVKI